MSLYHLEKCFRPASLALVGASPTPGTVGRVVLTKLRQSGFSGEIFLVNPKYSAIDGASCHPTLRALPAAPDLVVIASPPATVPPLVEEAGAMGCPGALVLTAGLGHGPGSLSEQARALARQHRIRLIGPNTVGLMVPASRLDASFAARSPTPGNLAVISQSGAIAVGMVEWAHERSIGFSAIVSLGDMVDVDVGDCLDYFAQDRATRAILLYLESVTDAQKFMSAARAAARAKPVIVLKAGRHAAGARAAATHTGALAGSDAVYDAAFRRAGLIRVEDLGDLFTAAETLGREPPFAGDRLAILTNGGGVGVLAVDRLAELGGQAAGLSSEALSALDTAMPSTWSRANPVDIIGDADAKRYRSALDILLKDPANDGLLVLQVPTALAEARETARVVAETALAHRNHRGPRKPVFAAWLGAGAAVSDTFEEAGLPNFATESDAVRGFMHLVRYHEGQRTLAQTPEALPATVRCDATAAAAVVAEAVAAGRSWLTPLEAHALLAAYGIPAVTVSPATDSAAAVTAARPILQSGGTVAIKILSPDIVHKSDVGGVRLDLATEEAVAEATRDVLERARRLKPEARLDGVLVQAMVRRSEARELIAGLAEDPVFGPVVLFGCGGTAVEVVEDSALALPPLDLGLARQLVRRTRVSKLLDGYRNVRAADRAAVELVLVKLAQLSADNPEISSLDINPLLTDADGVLAVDARVSLAPAGRGPSPRGNPRFAIRPYPRSWERTLTTPAGERFFTRPVRPEDEGRIRDFLCHVSPGDLRLRFHGAVDAADHAFLARLVQLDYARATAFLALDEADGAVAGVVRLHVSGDRSQGEFAILVRSDRQGQGLGRVLMELMLAWAREEAIPRVTGTILQENSGMLALCASLGFELRPDPGDISSVIATMDVAPLGEVASGGPDVRTPPR